jgi:uncharacterized protein
MDCIKCKKAMSKSKLQGVLVDKCNICGGIWLDGGELNMIKYNDCKDDNTLLKEARGEVLEEKMRLIVTEGLCPKCQKQRINTYVRSGVEIDQCPACGGIFFDYGELDRVVNSEKTGFKKFLYGFKKQISKKV